MKLLTVLNTHQPVASLRRI